MLFLKFYLVTIRLEVFHEIVGLQIIVARCIDVIIGFMLLLASFTNFLTSCGFSVLATSNSIFFY